MALTFAATGATSYQYRPATPQENTPRVVLEVAVAGIMAEAMVDTGGVYLLCHSRLARQLDIDASQAVSPVIKLLGNPKAFVEFVLAFILSICFPLNHKTTWHGGGGLTRHSPYARVRLGGLTLWRMQCTTCKAVCTVLPHVVLRYRRMSPTGVRQAGVATHGGLSLEWSAMSCNLSPLALYRLVWALGQQRLVAVLTGCGWPLPVSILVDEKHHRCLTDTVYLPIIASGRVIWPLGYRESKRAAACTESYGQCPRAVLQHEPSYRVQDALTDGFDSTTKSMRALFPRSRLGSCVRYALIKLRAHCSVSRLRCARACAPRFTPCWTGVASTKASGGGAGPAVTQLCGPHRRHRGPPPTGCSTCTSAPQAAFDERCKHSTTKIRWNLLSIPAQLSPADSV